MEGANNAELSCLYNGATIGGVAGGIGGYVAAKNAKINPWTGRPDKSVTIGEGMKSDVEKGWMGIDKISKDLESGKFEPSDRLLNTQPELLGKPIGTSTELMNANAETSNNI